MHTFGLRSNELGLRVLSLDHLGTIAARLRKDAVTSTKQDNDEIIEILSKVDATVITTCIFNTQHTYMYVLLTDLFVSTCEGTSVQSRVKDTISH